MCASRSLAWIQFQNKRDDARTAFCTDTTREESAQNERSRARDRAFSLFVRATIVKKNFNEEPFDSNRFDNSTLAGKKKKCAFAVEKCRKTQSAQRCRRRRRERGGGEEGRERIAKSET